MATDAGYPFDWSSINARAGSLAVQLDRLLDDIHAFKVRLIDDHTQAEVQAIATGAGAATAAADLVRSGIIDLDKLFQVATGQTTQTPASDFFFNARKLTGVTGTT